MLGTVTVGGGKSPSVSITVEARMGNKVVTHIRGLDIFGIDMATFSKECSKKFAASSTIGPVNTNPKEKEIVIQVKKKEDHSICLRGMGRLSLCDSHDRVTYRSRSRII